MYNMWGGAKCFSIYFPDISIDLVYFDVRRSSLKWFGERFQCHKLIFFFYARKCIRVFKVYIRLYWEVMLGMKQFRMYYILEKIKSDVVYCPVCSKLLRFFQIKQIFGLLQQFGNCLCSTVVKIKILTVEHIKIIIYII